MSAPMGPMGGGNVSMGSPGVPMSSMGPRQMGPQVMDPQQQKLMQQQQMLRAQQQAAMQQHIVRPPPPDYKASAGMMQGMQPRFNNNSTGPGNMRRMPHQPMPPSGISFFILTTINHINELRCVLIYTII